MSSLQVWRLSLSSGMKAYVLYCMHYPTYEALFDFSFLTNILVALNKTNDIEALEELFERCGHLINVMISCKQGDAILWSSCL